MENLIIATRIKAQNTANGGPRKAYIVREFTPQGVNVLDVIEEDYAGRTYVIEAFPTAKFDIEITVSVPEYRHWIREGEIVRKK